MSNKLESMADLVSRLAAYFCSYAEISDITGMEIPELQKNFGKIIKKNWANVKVNIRQKQLKKGLEDGDTRMLIWLGKQYLGQSDKVQTYLEAEINQTIKIGWADEPESFVASGTSIIETQIERKTIEQLNNEVGGNFREVMSDQLSAAVSDESAKDVADVQG